MTESDKNATLSDTPASRALATALLSRISAIIDATAMDITDIQVHDESVRFIGKQTEYLRFGGVEEHNHDHEIPMSILLDGEVNIYEWMSHKIAADRQREEDEKEATRKELARVAAERTEREERETYQRLHTRFGSPG